ncbi:MAG: LexA family protein, partial [Cytophagales bacterium]
MKLHKTQEILLELLKSNIDNPMTIRDLQDELGLSSPSVVHHHLQQLELKGLLKRNPNNARDYQILDGSLKEIVYLNLYGLAQCGPAGSILDGSPADRIPIASRILKFPSEEGFIVKAKGDSMEPTIKAGDLVIAQKNKVAKSGDVIVCVNNEVAIIKQIHIQEDRVILQSFNSKHPPILAAPDFRVEG